MEDDLSFWSTQPAVPHSMQVQKEKKREENNSYLFPHSIFISISLRGTRQIKSRWQWRWGRGMTEYSGDFVSLSLALNCVGDGLFWRLSANSLWRLAAKLAGQVTQASKDINEGSEPQTRQTRHTPTIIIALSHLSPQPQFRDNRLMVAKHSTVTTLIDPLLLDLDLSVPMIVFRSPQAFTNRSFAH